MRSTSSKRKKRASQKKSWPVRVLEVLLMAGGVAGMVLVGVGTVVLSVGFLVSVVGLVMAPFAGLFQLVWNGFVASVFEGPRLTFWQAYSGGVLIALAVSLIRRALGKRSS